MDISYSFSMLPALLIGLTGLSVIVLASLMWVDAINERRSRQATLRPLKPSMAGPAKVSSPVLVKGGFAELDVPKAA